MWLSSVIYVATYPSAFLLQFALISGSQAMRNGDWQHEFSSSSELALNEHYAFTSDLDGFLRSPHANHNFQHQVVGKNPAAGHYTLHDGGADDRVLVSTSREQFIAFTPE